MTVFGFELMAKKSSWAVANDPVSRQLGQVTLAPGTHFFDLVYYERSGGSEVELFAAAGSYVEFAQTDTWRLIGDVNAGGLPVVTEPLPPQDILWTRSEPVGSLVFEFTDAQDLPAGSSGAIYRTELLAGQTLSVAASPQQTDAITTLSLRNANGIVASRTASAGEAAVIQTYRADHPRHLHAPCWQSDSDASHAPAAAECGCGNRIVGRRRYEQ